MYLYVPCPELYVRCAHNAQHVPWIHYYMIVQAKISPPCARSASAGRSVRCSQPCGMPIRQGAEKAEGGSGDRGRETEYGARQSLEPTAAGNSFFGLVSFDWGSLFSRSLPAGFREDAGFEPLRNPLAHISDPRRLWALRDLSPDELLEVELATAELETARALAAARASDTRRKARARAEAAMQEAPRVRNLSQFVRDEARAKALARRRAHEVKMAHRPLAPPPPPPPAAAPAPAFLSWLSSGLGSRGGVGGDGASADPMQQPRQAVSEADGEVGAQPRRQTLSKCVSRLILSPSSYLLPPTSQRPTSLSPAFLLHHEAPSSPLSTSQVHAGPTHGAAHAAHSTGRWPATCQDPASASARRGMFACYIH